MSNPLMQGKQNAQQQQQISPQQALSQIKSDSVGYLKQAGYNVPEEIANNPMAIAQHLIQSGQIPRTRLTSLMQMLGRR
jgi:hypothetical protein